MKLRTDSIIEKVFTEKLFNLKSFWILGGGRGRRVLGDGKHSSSVGSYCIKFWSSHRV
jgi:hypothetical protein